MKMSTLHRSFRFGILLCFLFPVFQAQSQSLAVNDLKGGDEDLLIVAKHQKRMPAGYDGFVVEVASSDLPLKSSDPVFKKFGNIYYHKLREGGYSYVIMTNFSDIKVARNFCTDVVAPKVPGAKLIEYKKGVRFIK